MPEHYFSRHPRAVHRHGAVQLVLPDVSVQLVTDSGVFSARRLDPGTRVLLETAPGPPASGNVLDLGCGYGPIAVVLAARSPGAAVWAVDVNARALELCSQNAARAGLRNVRCLAPDEVEPQVRFQAIYSNPPIRIGKQALYSLLTGWLRRLAPGGAAYLVAHRHLGADSLHKWLASEGWAASRLVSRGGYRVLVARRSSVASPPARKTSAKIRSDGTGSTTA